MRIRCALAGVLTLLFGLSLCLQAQVPSPPKRPPQLTMDDLENRSASPVSTSREIPSPTGTSDAAAEAGRKNSSGPRLMSDAQARVIVEAAWKRMTGVKSGRLEYLNQSSAGVRKMLYEFAAADRGRIVTEKEELVVIGETAYVNESGKGWKKTTKEEQLKSSDLTFKFFANYSSARTTQVQLVGEEVILQVPMLKFKVMEEDGNSNYTWIRKNDGLIYKMESSLSNPERFIRAIYSDFNSTILIAPPV